MFLRQIFDESLAQYAYLVGCQRTGEAIVIDPERDIDRYLKIAGENDLRITAVTETHIHADFVSGSRQFLETQSGVTAYLSDMGDSDWKYQWADSPNVRLLKDGDKIHIGKIEITAIHTPGHTPEHLTFAIEDHGGGADQPVALATGDFVFVGDVGRPDLLESAAGHTGAMEPSARTLYTSLQGFTSFPEYTQILPGHGAGSACGKALGAIPSSTVGYEKRFNSAIQTAIHAGEDAFVDEILAGQPEPPVYFARMKRVNKEGPEILSQLPAPTYLGPAEITGLSGQSGNAFLDLRNDSAEFMRSHLKGSLFSPAKGNFVEIAGSYLAEDENIYLLLNEHSELEEAVRKLIRIGLDRIKGWGLISEVLASGEQLTGTRHEHISNLHSLWERHPSAIVLDVRRAAEYEAGHVNGSINIAYTRLATNLDKLPEGAELMVHCASGGRAAHASAYLESKGFRVTFWDGMFDSLAR